MQPKSRSTAEASVPKSAEEPNGRSLRTKAPTKVESVIEEKEDSTISVKASSPKKPRSQDQKEATVVVVEEADFMRVPKTSSPLKSKKMAKLDSQDIKEDVVIEDESSTSSPEPASQKKPKEKEKQKKSDLLGVKVSPNTKTSGSKRKREIKLDDDVGETIFIGESIPEEEAKQRWPHRYLGKVSASVRYQKKVRWKGYGADVDSWEPIQGLSNCRESIKEFITNGYNGKILPLPGDVDVACGGPPCQGISGFNRFRNRENPLDDPKNKQLLVFMEVVEFLKPKFVLMENVVDIVKFAGGFLGRYALGRLVSMDYQSRMGMMVAGAYGLPQFCMRVFIWGALSVEKLPQYPLPTHDVVIRGGVPIEFERNIVAYDEGRTVPLEKKLLLEDAISDLPNDEMSYDKAPKTNFQRYIRLSKEGKEEVLEAELVRLKEQLKQSNLEKTEISFKYEKLSAICRSHRQEIQELKQAVAARTPSPNRYASSNQTSPGFQSSATPLGEKIEGTVWELQQGNINKNSPSPKPKQWQAFAEGPQPQQTSKSVSARNGHQNQQAEQKTNVFESWGFGAESFTAVPSPTLGFQNQIRSQKL